MADLTNLESKLAEVLGLAQAAAGAGSKVHKLVKKENGELAAQVEQMRAEAKETAARCTEVAKAFDGKKTAIMEKARETKQEAEEMMSTYLGEDADALDGFEFLTMAEAGEVGHWEIVGLMGRRAGNKQVQELARWATPIQKRHFDVARKGALVLAEAEDPNEEAA